VCYTNALTYLLTYCINICWLVDCLFTGDIRMIPDSSILATTTAESPIVSPPSAAIAAAAAAAPSSNRHRFLSFSYLRQSLHSKAADAAAEQGVLGAICDCEISSSSSPPPAITLNATFHSNRLLTDKTSRLHDTSRRSPDHSFVGSDRMHNAVSSRTGQLADYYKLFYIIFTEIIFNHDFRSHSK